MTVLGLQQIKVNAVPVFYNRPYRDAGSATYLKSYILDATFSQLTS